MLLKLLSQQKDTILKVIEVIQNANLTLNPEKCVFGNSGIKLLDIIFTSKPDPEKVKALENIKPPKDKDELKCFICMVQSNSDFTPSFSKVVAPLRKLMNEGSIFWTHMHQKHLINF